MMNDVEKVHLGRVLYFFTVHISCLSVGVRQLCPFTFTWAITQTTLEYVLCALKPIYKLLHTHDDARSQQSTVTFSPSLEAPWLDTDIILNGWHHWFTPLYYFLDDEMVYELLHSGYSTTNTFKGTQKKYSRNNQPNSIFTLLALGIWIALHKECTKNFIPVIFITRFID